MKNDAPVTVERPYPELLNCDENAVLLKQAEQLWSDLQADNTGGFSGRNRPFYILHEFRRVIEAFGYRDTGLHWSNDDLEAARHRLAALASAPAESRVVRGYELAERHNVQVDAGTLDIDPRHDSNHPLHDIVCGWCGKVHSASAPAGDGVEGAATGRNVYLLQQDNARLCATLRWYGEQARLARLIHSEGDAARDAIAQDGGKRANDVLNSKGSALARPHSTVSPVGNGHVLMPRQATRSMVEAADACTDAYSAYNAMVEAGHVR